MLQVVRFVAKKVSCLKVHKLNPRLPLYGGAWEVGEKKANYQNGK